MEFIGRIYLCLVGEQLKLQNASLQIIMKTNAIEPCWWVDILVIDGGFNGTGIARDAHKHRLMVFLAR